MTAKFKITLILLAICSLQGTLVSALPKPKISKVKPGDVFSVVDEKGLTRYCTMVKGKAQYVVKKGSNSYTLGSAKLRALQQALKSAGKKLAKAKKKVSAFKKELSSGNTACRASDDSTSLEPIKRALTRADVALLLDRVGFGLGINDEALVDIGINQGVEALVDKLMETQVEPAGLMERVADRLDGQLGSTATQSPAGQRQAIMDLWIHTNNPYAEKMAMFLLSVWTASGEVIEDETFRSSFWNYYQRLRTYAFNDTYLPDLAVEITRDPLMLIYLNNELNVKGNPNENYARELMELFTLGPNDLDGNPNYTETTLTGEGDILIAAKMLTGWTVKKNYSTKALSASYEAARHETGPHTMFQGKAYQFSGENDEELVRGIFTNHPGVRNYYAREILKEYLTPDPPAALVKAFGKVIADANYKLRPAMKTLLMSEAFYESDFQDTVPYAPYALIARIVRVMGLQGAVNINNLHYETQRLGFFPNLAPSVFWYPQDAWNSSTAILEKANTLASLFGDRTSQTAAGWSPQSVLPVGAISNAALTDYVRTKLSLPDLNAGQTAALEAFLTTARQYNGQYVPFNYDNTNANHQRSKGLGLYYLLMLSPTFQLH